jgi:hypothetical protein
MGLSLEALRDHLTRLRVDVEAHLADQRVAAVIVQSPGSGAVGAGGHGAIGFQSLVTVWPELLVTSSLHSGSRWSGP